jgi:hypothetical protein
MLKRHPGPRLYRDDECCNIGVNRQVRQAHQVHYVIIAAAAICESLALLASLAVEYQGPTSGDNF